jgi:hypothetical protein
MKHICKNSDRKRYVGGVMGEYIDNYEIHYSRIVAIGECSDGNDSVGSMWLVSQTFDAATPIETIMKWAWENRVTGKLTITINQGSEIKKDE